ncbi:MAG: beta-lactamase family protein [Candidatus Eisenbacteria bacterium]|nr:beta-lactamase family protein [Candidatus Eisenbacteria bacterium]
MNGMHISNTPIGATALLLGILTVCGCGDESNAPTPPPVPMLERVAEEVRVRHQLPGLAVAAFTEDALDLAVTGTRRQDGADTIEERDLFHIGSQTKAMLATTVAKLVEEGVVEWSLSLAEAFPELATTMTSAYREVTLAQLLQHRSGMPGLDEYEQLLQLPAFPGTEAEQRQAFATWILSQPPASPVGTYVYSNAGYTVAAAIIERRTGQSWLSLLTSRLLDPLAIRAVVGWPLDHGADQPCGHTIDPDHPGSGRLLPIEPSLGRLPAVVAPAGDLSMDIADYGRFAQLHLRALNHHGAILADSTFQRLHQPIGDYAMGWSVLSEGENRVLFHDGSAGTFFAFAALYPHQGRGFVVLITRTRPPSTRRSST